jgi:diguanylate cyclase (GGDEF)-like protein
VSTELYPEWPFAKLAHTPDTLANKVLSALLRQPATSDASSTGLFNWTIPSDYSKVHMVLKDLSIYPYDKSDFTFEEVYKKYQTWISVGLIFFTIILAILLYIQYTNRRLEKEVRFRTQEISAANRKLRELASIDDLTGISNRRDFLEKLDHAINLAKRYHAPLALFSMDIDFFKKVNDTYGHDVGDAVLKHFVNVVKNTIRISDYFGRMGGEEFAVALSNTSYKDALVVAEKMRKSVQDSPYILLEGSPLNLTVSIGMTMLMEVDTRQEIIKRSDIALYQAKERGRNQVVIDETLALNS